MFNYRNNHTAGFQTPSVHSRRPQQIRNRVNNNNINNQNDAFSTIKPTADRRYRRFGTNLTNKRAVTRLGDSKTVQINKGPKQISFASKANNMHYHQSSFKFNVRVKNEEVIEPEYCPKATSWKPSIGKSLHRMFKKAFNAIGSYKLFVPSAKVTVIDYNIKQNFDYISEPNRASQGYLYDTESDDTEEDDFKNDDDRLGDIQLVCCYRS